MVRPIREASILIEFRIPPPQCEGCAREGVCSPQTVRLYVVDSKTVGASESPTRARSGEKIGVCAPRAAPISISVIRVVKKFVDYGAYFYREIKLRPAGSYRDQSTRGSHRAVGVGTDGWTVDGNKLKMD